MRVFKKKRKDKKVMLSSVNHPLRKINENKRFDFWDLFDNNKFKFIIYWIFCFEFLIHPWQTRQWLQKREKRHPVVRYCETTWVPRCLWKPLSRHVARSSHSNPLYTMFVFWNVMFFKKKILIFFIFIYY
jgi:hypothetical protein